MKKPCYGPGFSAPASGKRTIQYEFTFISSFREICIFIQCGPVFASRLTCSDIQILQQYSHSSDFSRLFVYCLLFASSCPFAGLGPNPNFFIILDMIVLINLVKTAAWSRCAIQFPVNPPPVAMIRNECNMIIQIEKVFTTSFGREPWKRDWGVYRQGCRQGRWITTSELHKSPYHTKSEFNNCSIIHSKYFQFLKSLPPRSLSSKHLPVFRHGFSDINNFFLANTRNM